MDIIRNISKSDYEDLHNLWNSCNGIGLNDFDDSVEGIERFLLKNYDTCFVAIKDSMIIASIMVGNDGRRAHIYHLAVHPSFRRQGIASELLIRSINQLKKYNINKLSLVVFKNNEEGNKFWEKFGFKIRHDLIYRDKHIL